MLPVLDNDQMREADRFTIEELGVPGMVLMENAATGVVDCLRECFPDARRILILCGRGNNGGDGFAAARHLVNGGLHTSVLLFADPEALSGDAASNYRLAVNFGIEVMTGAGVAELEQILNETTPDLVVDALLGTGIDRPLGGRLAAVAERVRNSGLPVLAVDVPTGLNGSAGTVPGPVLDADVTVTFAALKPCQVLPPACEHCGEVAVVDIGIPPAALEAGCSLRWVQAEDVQLLLPARATAAHKGSFGHLLILAGSLGRSGAVAMAARSAVVAGAGLVTMAVPRPLVPVVDGACLEAMAHAMDADDAGGFSGPDGLDDALQHKTAVAVGPGMGTTEGARNVFNHLLETWQQGLVVDADAINLLAGTPERLAERQGETVLTPHPGELARLLGTSTDEVVADRLAAATEAARRSGSVVVAKGYRSLIACPDGQACVNATGDAHLASGGSGDVLTGLIGALLAQGLDGMRAALVGCWLHGRAGELGGSAYPAAVPATELPSLLAKAWAELSGDQE